jgi:hypothetical protein
MFPSAPQAHPVTVSLSPSLYARIRTRGYGWAYIEAGSGLTGGEVPRLAARGHRDLSLKMDRPSNYEGGWVGWHGSALWQT